MLTKITQMKYFLIFLLLSTHLASQEPDSALRRIQAHLIIEDYQAAKEEAKANFDFYPDSFLIYEIYIKSLARLGEEGPMLEVWKEYVSRFPDKKENRELLEEMCWGVLDKAVGSPSLLTRIMGVIGAYFSKDSRGVEILKQSMNDSNAAIRGVAVELAASFRDAKLKDEVKRLFKEEKSWSVRKAVLKAIGSMKIKELSSGLEQLIASDQSMAEEKVLAIASLIELMDEIKRDKIEKLVGSNRSGLRLLACEAIAYFLKERDIDQLILLSNDNHADVRAAALQALGTIRPEGLYREIVLRIGREKAFDTDPKVALSAAWLLTIYSSDEGQRVFDHYISQEKKELRLLAASALNATGKYGVEHAVRLMYNNADPFVQLNIAMGVIGQRQATQEAGDIIDQVINQDKDKWISSEEGIFQYVAPRNSIKTDLESSDNNPEMENQLVRLKVLNALALIQPGKAQRSIRNFLIEGAWGVSGAASALLLMEGNDTSIRLVQGLLSDRNKKVQIQAALVLSLWSREESAIEVLEKNYWDSDKEMKARILEGIGRIGSMRSVPFLIEVLHESSQQLRIIGATAMIQCLNY